MLHPQNSAVLIVAILLTSALALTLAKEEPLEDLDTPCPDWGSEPNDQKVSYPSLAQCLEQLALLDLHAVLILQNPANQFADLPPDGVTGYVNDADVTIRALRNTNNSQNPPEVRNTQLDSNEEWSEKWLHKMASKTARNSLAAYRLIFRVVRKLKSLIETSEDFKDTLRKNLPAHLIPVLDELPTKNDLLEAARGIIRLQLVYNSMTSIDLVQGRILNVDTGVTLDPEHCFYLGVVAAKKIKNYPIALQWLDSALSLTRTVQNQTSDQELIPGSKSKFKFNDETEFLVKLEREINDTIQKHNHHFFHQPLKSKDHTSKSFGGKLFPSPLIIPSPVLSHFHYTFRKYMKELNTKEKEFRARMFQRIRRYQYEKEHLPKYTLWDPNVLIHAYNELCAGEDLLSEREKSRLFCWNERKTSPFYSIGPMKMEFISREPDIVQVYDVMGPKNIQKMENVLKTWDKRFKPGLSAKIKKGKPEIEAWELFIAEDAIVSSADNITWEKAFIHGKELLGIAREPHHAITKYTFTGRFLPHVDFLCGEKLCNGPERLASYMVYLSDVPLGGYTVFPHSRVFVRPIKGSAVYWFNLEGNLNGDKRSIHAGCPTPLGIKMKLGQFQRVEYAFHQRKCPLKDGQSFRIKVNGIE